MHKSMLIVAACLVSFILGLAVAMKHPDLFKGEQDAPIHTFPVPPKTTPYEKNAQGMMLYLGPGVSIQAVGPTGCEAKAP